MVSQVGVIMTVKVSLQEININQCNITLCDGNRTVYDITIQPKKKAFFISGGQIIGSEWKVYIFMEMSNEQIQIVCYFLHIC